MANTDIVFRDSRSFYKGFKRIKNAEGLWGYEDENGTIVIPCEWHCCSLPYTDGSIRVAKSFDEFIEAATILYLH